MNHTASLFIIIFTLLLLACKESNAPTASDNGNSETLNNESGTFTFKVTVKDTAGHPKSGVRVTPTYMLLERPDTLWGQMTIYKAKMLAKNGTNETLYSNSIYMIGILTYENWYFHGYTNQLGLYECNDTLLFPHALKQLDGIRIPRTTNMGPDTVGLIEVRQQGYIRISLQDTLTNQTMNYDTVIARGINEYEIFWNPQTINKTSGILSQTLLSSSFQVMNIGKSSLIMDVVPTPWGISQNYPNPFDPGTPTNIKIDVYMATSISVSVYNLRDQILKPLMNEGKQPGSYTLTCLLGNLR